MTELVGTLLSLLVIIILPVTIVVIIATREPKKSSQPHIELIKFMAVKPLRESLVANGTEHFHTIFGLGEGACGKTVSELRVNSSPTEMTIIQFHDDRTKKEFVYKKTDIVGRVEIQYGECA